MLNESSGDVTAPVSEAAKGSDSEQSLGLRWVKGEDKNDYSDFPLQTGCLWPPQDKAAVLTGIGGSASTPSNGNCIARYFTSYVIDRQNSWVHLTDDGTEMRTRLPKTYWLYSQSICSASWRGAQAGEEVRTRSHPPSHLHWAHPPSHLHGDSGRATLWGQACESLRDPWKLQEGGREAGFARLESVH